VDFFLFNDLSAAWTIRPSDGCRNGKDSLYSCPTWKEAKRTHQHFMIYKIKTMSQTGQAMPQTSRCTLLVCGIATGKTDERVAMLLLKFKLSRIKKAYCMGNGKKRVEQNGWHSKRCPCGQQGLQSQVKSISGTQTVGGELFPFDYRYKVDPV